VCGIVGTCGYAYGAAEVHALVATLAHRGPDATGLFHDERAPVWLGHRRLAIIDLSAAANQPFRKHELVLAFNGEIYNFRELRAELVGQGALFETQSDTEVLLEGWRAWGPGVLSRLRGMFAFAMYDRRSGELVLARDPFGIKPLFYIHEPERPRLAFASELKALVALGEGHRSVDETALAAMLLFDWIPEEHCIWRGVRKVQPGTYIRFDANLRSTTTRYWSIADLPTSPQISAAELEEVIRDAVDAHLVADVEVGSFLSGGLDSSLITAIAATRVRNMRCFTVSFRHADRLLEAVTDDLRHARSCARTLGLRLDEIEIGPDAQAMVPRIVELLDEPIGDAAAINVLLMCQAARTAGLKVMLSGTGADEIFSGYRRHHACLLASRYRQLPVLSREAIELVVRFLPAADRARGHRWSRWAKRFVGFAGLDEESAYRRSYTYYDPERLVGLLGGNGAAAIETLFTQHRDVYWAAGQERGNEAQLRRMFAADLHYFLPALNLAYTDRASMAASVEVRVPFVDVKVVAAAARLAGRDRIRGRIQKHALKKLAERWLPRSIVHRPKSSFGLPLRTWTMRDLREPIRDLLERGELVSRGYVDRRTLDGLLAANERGQADHAQAIWQLFTLEHWFRAHRAPIVRDRVHA
jgi:asparagine synthase (glutamine-hydrolysing)